MSASSAIAIRSEWLRRMIAPPAVFLGPIADLHCRRWGQALLLDLAGVELKAPGCSGRPGCYVPKQYFALGGGTGKMHGTFFEGCKRMSVFDWVSGRVFKFVHGNNLVYNTCWEDPRLDRVALQIQSSDNILVITSAGCNALDYALCGPNHVHAVDMNPRQNALLDLKIAGIKTLEFEDFFRLLGYGFHPDARRLYQRQMRPPLPAWSQAWWDTWIKFFDNKARPFYFRGTSGAFARMIKIYTDRVIRVRHHIDSILDAKTLAEQQEIYDKHLKQKFWSRPMRFAM